MPLTHKEIKEYFDKDYQYSKTTRERGADDLVFYWITQWDENSINTTQLSYRGQFDILRKAGRGISADLATNPVQVDFFPTNEERDDAGEFADGLYRAGLQNNVSMEAFSNAEQETIVCGMGSWELFTDYESIRDDSNNQVIKRRPIPEANNTVFFDCGARLLDKSDAMRGTILTAYSEDGYKDLYEDLTGEEEAEELDLSSFSHPEISYVFPWIGSGTTNTVHIATFYHKEIVEDKIITMVSPVGQESQLWESDLEDIMDDMIDNGFEIVNEKEVKRWEVRKYIVSGKEILNGEENSDGEREGEIIAGEYIPIIPEYGERALIEGEEHWEGITRVAKDPQRLYNFEQSYLADIVSKSPRQKPIFTPEQIQGFENYYKVTGAENNYPYLLQNLVTQNGQPLPIGPVGVMPDTPIPQALIASIGLSRQAVEDVANPGVPKEYPSGNGDVSGKAIQALQSKIEQQSVVFQENRKHARRHDGVVWASMAVEVYDTPRTVSVVGKDGTRRKVKVMEQIYDTETGKFVTLNDINNTEFEVFSKIGPDYKTQKDQTRDMIKEVMITLPPGSPDHTILMNMLFQLTDGVEFEDLRNRSRNQLVMMGVKKPETPEEEQMFKQAQAQQNQPSAEMVMAMAEDKKGQADLLEQQRRGIEMQLEFQNKNTANEIDAFEAQTKRMDTQVDASEADAKIDNTRMDTFGKQIENQKNIKEMVVPLSEMTDEALIQELMAG